MDFHETAYNYSRNNEFNFTVCLIRVYEQTKKLMKNKKKVNKKNIFSPGARVIQTAKTGIRTRWIFKPLHMIKAKIINRR